MEFRPSNGFDKWADEILSFQYEKDGKTFEKIPQGKKLRIRVRWRESVEWSTATLVGETAPRAKARLNVLLVIKENALAGRKLIDDFSVVQETGNDPFCIFRNKNFAIFEHLIEIETPAEGQYSIVIEGKVPNRNVLSPLDSHKVFEVFPEITFESFEKGSRFKVLN